MRFGDNLKELRKAAGLTQEKLGEILSVSMQAVSRWETTDTLPDAALLPPLADALGTSIDALFGGRETGRRDVMRAVKQYSEDRKNGSPAETMYRVASGSLLAAFGHKPEDLTPAGSDSDPFDLRCAFGQVSYVKDGGIGWLFGPRFPYAAVLLKPEAGYAAHFRDAGVEALFDALGDRDVRACLSVLFEGPSRFLSLDALLEQAGIPGEREEEIAAKLSSIDPSAIAVRELRIDGEDCRMVDFRDWAPGIPMLFAAAFACRISHRAMMGEWAGRERPLYGKPEPEKAESPRGAE